MMRLERFMVTLPWAICARTRTRTRANTHFSISIHFYSVFRFVWWILLMNFYLNCVHLSYEVFFFFLLLLNTEQLCLLYSILSSIHHRLWCSMMFYDIIQCIVWMADDIIHWSISTVTDSRGERSILSDDVEWTRLE